MRYPISNRWENQFEIAILHGIFPGMIGLPASFSNAGYFTCQSQIAEHVTSHTEVAHVTSWTTGQLTSVVQANRRSIFWKQVQSCVVTFCFQGSTLFCKLSNHSRSLSFAGFYGFFCHNEFKIPVIIKFQIPSPAGFGI